MTIRHLLIAIALLLITSAVLLLFAPVAGAASARAILIEARELAYDANYRNDQSGLRAAITSLETLTNAPDVGPDAQYYLSWTYWALAASQFQANDLIGALASGEKAVEHARVAVAAREKDPEFQTALANALVVVGVLGKRLSDKAFMAEFTAARRSALELGPQSPRVVWMDCGAIFNSPPDMGGSRERGLARCEEALALFDAEGESTSIDPISPRWGNALAHGWIAQMYLRMTPVQQDKARRAAETALRMRPDFWWVREQVMPKMRE